MRKVLGSTAGVSNSGFPHSLASDEVRGHVVLKYV
jgi:hypothetical protein